MTAAAQTAALDYKSMPDNTNLDHIPGDYGLIPYLGKTMDVLNNLRPLLNEHYTKYGTVSRLLMGGRKGVLVLGADNWQRVYLDKDKNFSTEMGYAESLGYFYKGGLLLRDFDEHRFQRRIFQNAFKTNAMKEYIHTMNPMLKEGMDSWQGTPNFLFFPHIKQLLLEVGATIFLGIDKNDKEMTKLNQAFLDVANGLLGLFKLRIPGLKFHKGMVANEYLTRYFAKLIPLRRASEGSDMLSFMCKEKMENGEFFPDSDLIPHASFLLFAAHDTTTSALCHMLYHTAKNPEWQERLRAESLALGKPALEYDDLDNMVGLELVFKESLRMNPSVAMMTRRTVRECEIDGVRIPANTVLYLPPAFNHYDSRYWSNPEKFDPERFSPERQEEKNHSFCYTPFGGGAHKCIGMHFANMQAKCFMHQFLLKYRYSVPANYNPKMDIFPLPKPADGLPLKLEPIA
jgi:cytochrome P450